MTKCARKGDAHICTRMPLRVWLLGVLQGKAVDAMEEEGGSMDLYRKTAFMHQYIANPHNHRANLIVFQRLFLNRLKGFLRISAYASFPSTAAAGWPHHRATGTTAPGPGPRLRGGRPGPGGSAYRTEGLSAGVGSAPGALSNLLPSRSRRRIPPRHDACVPRAAPRPPQARPLALGPRKGLPPLPTPSKRCGG